MTPFYLVDPADYHAGLGVARSVDSGTYERFEQLERLIVVFIEKKSPPYPDHPVGVLGNIRIAVYGLLPLNDRLVVSRLLKVYLSYPVECRHRKHSRYGSAR